MVGTVYTSTTLGTFPGLYIGTFPLSVDSIFSLDKIKNLLSEPDSLIKIYCFIALYVGGNHV